MNVHSVFPVSLLAIVAENQMEGEIVSPPLQEIVDGKVEYKVNVILNFRMYQWRLEYLVN